MIRSIKIWPDAALKSPCETVEEFDEELQELVQDLWDTMIHYGGMGIAAPQIGVAKSVFLIKTSAIRDELGIDCGNAPDVWVFTNAILFDKSKETTEQHEGCLSFPGIILKVKRPKTAFIHYQDVTGEIFNLETTGYLTNAVLHEMDHISGRTIADFVGILKKKSIRKKLKEYEQK